MAGSQQSWGLKIFLASIVLLFCLAVTTVEGRSIPFIAQLTPENTGRVNSNNRNLVGQAFAYLSSAGSDFHVSILVVVNIDPKDILRVQLYNVDDQELIGTKFDYLRDGYYVYDQKISYRTGANMNIERLGVAVYTEKIGSDRPALDGLLINNRTTFIADLKASEEVTPPTGTEKNDGFATVTIWSTDSINFFLSAVVNHDLDQRVSTLHIHAPAASGTGGVIVVNFPNSTFLPQAAKILNVPINSTVVYWLSNHLGYVNIHTTVNMAGALRGQLIPTTTPRLRTPEFPNKSTQQFGGLTQTFLPDGGAIFGDVGAGLRNGGARNLTGNTTDDRVALFTYNDTTSAFNNLFRFELPVTRDNKFSLRSAVLYVTAATEVADNNKWNVGLFDLSNQAPVNFIQVPGTGRRSFATYQLNIDAESFPTYLGPGGLFVNIQATGLSSIGLFVDRFYVVYYVNNAYANNIVKSIFYKGSDARN